MMLLDSVSSLSVSKRWRSASFEGDNEADDIFDGETKDIEMDDRLLAGEGGGVLAGDSPGLGKAGDTEMARES